jgi:hypothetical protein
MHHAPGAIAPLNPEMVQVGNAVGQRAQRRGLFQGSVRPVGVVEVFVLAQDGQTEIPGPRSSYDGSHPEGQHQLKAYTINLNKGPTC